MEKTFCDNCGAEVGSQAVRIQTQWGTYYGMFSPWHNRSYPKPDGVYCGIVCARAALLRCDERILDMNRTGPGMDRTPENIALLKKIMAE